jgi:hypothetical protein
VPYDVSKYIRYAEIQLVDNLLQPEGASYWLMVCIGLVCVLLGLCWLLGQLSAMDS